MTSSTSISLDREVDLTNCDREPIHIPGAILPHGAMLVLGGDRLEVVQAAGDTLGLLGLDAEALLGRSPEQIFTAERAQRLHDLWKRCDLTKSRHMLDPQLRVQPDLPLDASIHQSDNLLVIEFEAADLADDHADDPLGCVNESLVDWRACRRFMPSAKRRRNGCATSPDTTG